MRDAAPGVSLGAVSAPRSLFLVGAALLLSAAPAVRAQGEPTAAPPSAPTAEPTKAVATGKEHLPCGCAQPRLIRRGRTAPLGGGASVAAWIDLVQDGDAAHPSDRGASVETFAADFFERRARSPEDRAFPVERTVFVAEGALPSKHQLVRVHLGGEQRAPFYLGLLRENEEVPKDIVEVTPGEAGPPSEDAPVLAQLWLDRLDLVDREACGPAFMTTRLAWEEAEGSPEVAGFLVTYQGADGTRTSAIIDERHARSFGVGRPRRCDHGLDLPDGALGNLVIEPVSASLGVGVAWTFALSTESSWPLPGPRPAGAPPAEEVPNPFDDLGELGDSTDKAALGAMLGVVGMAVTAAAFLWPVLRRRRRRLETIACPACKAEQTLDLLDPSTDGMFCPTCGKSSVYVTREADGEPRATVLLLGRDPPAPPQG